MAKVELTLKNEDTITIVADEDFYFNYDEEKHGEEITKASNTRRSKSFVSSVNDAMRGETVGARIIEVDGKQIQHTFVDQNIQGIDDRGNLVIVDGSQVISAIFSD